MSDAPEAYHVYLVLVPDEEMIEREAGQKLEAARLDVFDLTVRLEHHCDWIVQFWKLVLGRLFPWRE